MPGAEQRAPAARDRGSALRRPRGSAAAGPACDRGHRALYSGRRASPRQGAPAHDVAPSLPPRSALRAGLDPARRRAEARARCSTGSLGRAGGRRRVLDLLFHLPSGIVSRGALGLDRGRADRRAGDARRARSRRTARRRRGGAGALSRAGRGRDRRRDARLLQPAAAARWSSMLPLGARRSSRARSSSGTGTARWCIPARIVDERQARRLPALEPVYGLTEGVTSRLIVAETSARRSSGCPTCPNGRTRPGSRANGFAAPSPRRSRAAARRRAGGPDSTPEAARPIPSRRRLAYDELLASQLALALVRSRQRRRGGPRQCRRRARSSRGIVGRPALPA